ncbi:MAG: ABC transporter substrate-binding protein, partial [Alphaproteobacteria bacterium]|nr:ABC transporter substrate-binding protein [Alphaproteobacteria bacterium]
MTIRTASSILIPCILAPVLAFSGLILSPAATGAEEPVWQHATVMIGEAKYPEGFSRFDYVNPDAPKGGTLKLSEEGTFDSFNPILAKGELATGLGLVFDTLMKSSEDEVSASYGLLAEGVSYPDDISKVTFRLRAEARWADGEPV